MSLLAMRQQHLRKVEEESLKGEEVSLKVFEQLVERMNTRISQHFEDNFEKMKSALVERSGTKVTLSTNILGKRSAAERAKVGWDFYTTKEVSELLGSDISVKFGGKLDHVFSSETDVVISLLFHAIVRDNIDRHFGYTDDIFSKVSGGRIRSHVDEVGMTIKFTLSLERPVVGDWYSAESFHEYDNYTAIFFPHESMQFALNKEILPKVSIKEAFDYLWNLSDYGLTSAERRNHSSKLIGEAFPDLPKNLAHYLEKRIENENDRRIYDFY